MPLPPHSPQQPLSRSGRWGRPGVGDLRRRPARAAPDLLGGQLLQSGRRPQADTHPDPVVSKGGPGRHLGRHGRSGPSSMEGWLGLSLPTPHTKMWALGFPHTGLVEGKPRPLLTVVAEQGRGPGPRAVRLS